MPLVDLAALLAENEGLRQRLASQPVIEQAKGILMGYYGIDTDTAFQLLCHWSQDTNTKLRRIAELLTESAAHPAGSRPAPHEIVKQVLPSRHPQRRGVVHHGRSPTTPTQSPGRSPHVTSPTQQLAPALDIDARLTEIERSLNLLLNLTPVNAAAVSYTHLTLPTTPYV